MVTWNRYRMLSGEPKEMWANKLRWVGASESTIRDLQLGGEDNGLGWLSYRTVLMRLPPEKGVVLEFWHSVPELYSMSRQYALLKRQPGAYQVRLEALRDDYNGTVLVMMDHLKLRKDSQEFLKATLAAGCDPGAWSEDRRASDPHITSWKEEEVAAAAVEAALLSHAPAKRIMCDLCREMEYEDPRCN